MTTLPIRNSISRSPLRFGFLLIPLVLACFALSPIAQAVSPAPDGGYPGGNTAEGQNALFSLTTGGFNAAVGFFSLFSNTTGSFNTAVGAGALDLNTADNNTATGAAALLLNTKGDNNTATGVDALALNDTGSQNTAYGAFALFNNTTPGANTATGYRALYSNTTGDSNTANGASALFSNTIGPGNTADGAAALLNNIDGDNNTAVGLNALVNNTSGAKNVALGSRAGEQQTTGSNNVYIGANIGGTAGESNACYISSIFSQTSVTGIPVLVNINNKLGTTTSSKRFKEDIKPMDKTSEALFNLKPVSFRYKKDIDPAGTPQLGLVAEDVEAVNPGLVVRDKEGKPYTVRYDAVNAMLLNEFLKEHRKVENLEATVAQQHKDFEAAVAELKGQIQKVSAQLAAASPSRGGLEASKFARRTAGRIRGGGPATQMVNNP